MLIVQCHCTLGGLEALQRERLSCLLGKCMETGCHCQEALTEETFLQEVEAQNLAIANLKDSQAFNSDDDTSSGTSWSAQSCQLEHCPAWL